MESSPQIATGSCRNKACLFEKELLRQRDLSLQRQIRELEEKLFKC
jgi:hypothetical protein